MKMNKKMKKYVCLLFTIIMVAMNVLPVFAFTSKYGEDKPLRSKRTIQLTISAGHKHTYIDASNGCRYQLYHSCMDGMEGSTPTNHSSTVTIDGVKYSLCNYGYKNKCCSYASVIKRIGGTPKKQTVALQKIALNKSSMTINVGTTTTLSISYIPSNTTDNKSITWTSSNKNIAAVSGGKVTAKKTGSATITAKVGSKKASCKITVRAASSPSKKPSTTKTVSESYKDVSEAYTLLNSFRLNKTNQWHWNKANTAKVKTNGLKALKKDSSLEKTAKIRAKEAWTMYYEKGKITHTRPNGLDCYTAYPASFRYKGENLAWGHTTCSFVISDPTWGWAETNADYSGQAHRRNMLNNKFTRVGIACYVKNGKTSWAMCLGN